MAARDVRRALYSSLGVQGPDAKSLYETALFHHGTAGAPIPSLLAVVLITPSFFSHGGARGRSSAADASLPAGVRAECVSIARLETSSRRSSADAIRVGICGSAGARAVRRSLRCRPAAV